MEFFTLGETSCRAMERGSEHFKDLEYTQSKNHMVSHIVSFHEDSDPNSVAIDLHLRGKSEMQFSLTSLMVHSQLIVNWNILKRLR